MSNAQNKIKAILNHLQGLDKVEFSALYALGVVFESFPELGASEILEDSASYAAVVSQIKNKAILQKMLEAGELALSEKAQQNINGVADLLAHYQAVATDVMAVFVDYERTTLSNGLLKSNDLKIGHIYQCVYSRPQIRKEDGVRYYNDRKITALIGDNVQYVTVGIAGLKYPKMVSSNQFLQAVERDVTELCVDDGWRLFKSK